jgi:hypothetical protein
MKRPRNISRPGLNSALWLVLSLLSAASMAFYVYDIWSANQPAGFSDLYARWWGTHELFLHGRDPYSAVVSHEIQSVIYGATLAPTPDDPLAVGGGFAYPPYVAFLLWPTIYTPFSVAQKLFLCISVPLTVLSLALWLRAGRSQLSVVRRVILVFFVLGSFPALEAIKLQNLSVFAAAFIAIAIFFLVANRLILAGIFLAASTFKPQFTMALILWLLLWTLADWRRRRSLAYSFVTTMLALVLVSEGLVPGWIASFLRIARAYRHYAYGYSLFDVWLTPRFGPIASVALLLASMFLCWPYRWEDAGSPKFFLATGLALAATVVVMPTLAPHAQLLLVPGVLCLLCGPDSLRTSNLPAHIFRAAAWTLLAWPWVASFGLVLAAVWLPLELVRRFWEVPLYTSPLLPLGITLAVGALLGSNGDRLTQAHSRD